MGLGTTIAAPPSTRGTSRAFQRALEHLSTTSGGFKTFTLKISRFLWFYGFMVLSRPKRGVFTSADPNRIKFGQPPVPGPSSIMKHV